jgi:hypothetical protein
VGLGDTTLVDIEVTWPDGTVTLESDVAADQILLIQRN